MDLRRKLNAALAATMGYEIRKARPSSSPAAPKPAEPKQGESKPEAKPKAKTASAEFREPGDPAVDRLLEKPVFIISPVRSGSTLLRLLLNGHSQLHSPHELHIRRLEVNCSTSLAARSMQELDLERGDLEHLLWDRVMHRELMKHQKSFIVEKTPSNAFVWQRLAACWPDAQFIFLLRHPLSIAKSWHEADPKKRDAEEAALDALRYMKAVQKARDGRVGHVVRYEDLTGDPGGELQRICAFLDIDWEPQMLEYGDGTEGGLQKGLGDWKDKIRSGSVQSGRELPETAEIPESLRAMCETWGYLGAEDRAEASAS